MQVSTIIGPVTVLTGFDQALSIFPDRAAALVSFETA